VTSYGQNTPLSIKTFRDGSLDAAGCLDFSRVSDAEQLAVAGQGPMSDRETGGKRGRGKTGTKTGTVTDLFGKTGGKRAENGDSHRFIQHSERLSLRQKE